MDIVVLLLGAEENRRREDRGTTTPPATAERKAFKCDTMNDPVTEKGAMTLKRTAFERDRGIFVRLS